MAQIHIVPISPITYEIYIKKNKHQNINILTRNFKEKYLKNVQFVGLLVMETEKIQTDPKSSTTKHLKSTNDYPTSISPVTSDNDDNKYGGIGIECLPVEILLEICTYLEPKDLHALEKVSESLAKVVRGPLVWKNYEVKETDPDTRVVIEQLKRMPLLEQITIHTRPDCDDILRQLSRTNQKLKKLQIINCTGSTGRLYLQSSHLNRILKRCNRLDTIHILGSRFRGKKFYCLLGNMKTRLRTLATQATSSQFLAFTKHADHLTDQDKAIMCTMPFGRRTWAPMRYFLIEKADSRYPLELRKIRKTVLVSYVDNSFLSIDIGGNTNQHDSLHDCP